MNCTPCPEVALIVEISVLFRLYPGGVAADLTFRRGSTQLKFFRSVITLADGEFTFSL